MRGLTQPQSEPKERVYARQAAQELTASEVEAVSGAGSCLIPVDEETFGPSVALSGDLCDSPH